MTKDEAAEELRVVGRLASGLACEIDEETSTAMIDWDEVRNALDDAEVGILGVREWVTEQELAAAVSDSEKG